MEQRPLRLGDIVDDYCPRERRITNHAVVALVGESIKQTRCSTCDTEHVYKEARVPRRKKKDDIAALQDQVLADAGGGQLVAPRSGAPEDGQPDADDLPLSAASAEAASEPVSLPQDEESAAEEPAGQRDDHLWPAHRRLIRATLPRTENDPPVARPIPEFTMHQRQYGRGGQPFRYGQGHGNGNGNGNGWQGGAGQPPRHAGSNRPGRPGGDPGNGDGNAPPGQGRRRSGRHRGGKHRRPR